MKILARAASVKRRVPTIPTVPGVPLIQYPLASITGAQTAGATLTRPTYVWPDPGWSSLVIVGTWWKNGVATESHGATFSDWVLTDTLEYRESATNENGVSAVPGFYWKKWYAPAQWAKTYVDATAGGEAAMIRFLDDPITPYFTGVWMKEDKNNYHQARAPGFATKYLINTNLWCYAFADSLSAVSVALEYPYPGNSVVNEGWMCKRGVTAITPQHVVGCAHGPVGEGTADYPCRVRFRGTDGETYDRSIVGYKACGGASTVNVAGVAHGGDSWIGTLDAPLPAVVHPARCIPENFKSIQAAVGITWDRLFVSQSVESESGSAAQPQAQKNYYPYSQPDYTQELYHPHYPWRHRTMCCFVWSNDPKVGYHPWAGDSGMPTFIAAATELLWCGFANGGGAGPDAYPYVQGAATITWQALANQMIADADADAITKEFLSVPTGYTVIIAANGTI